MRIDHAFLVDLDGTLVDSVYQHVLAWKQALDAESIDLSVWRVHRKIEMSGGLFTSRLPRETAVQIMDKSNERLRNLHTAVQARPLGVGPPSGGYGREQLRNAGAIRVYDDPLDLLRHIDEVGSRR